MRVLVGTDIKDTGILFKQVLSTIAVMYVPVEDQYFLKAVLLLQVPGGDRNIVEEAKAQCRVVFCVVTGRANQGKTVI